MALFFKKLILFIFPMLIFVVGIAVVDPFKMFGSQVFSEKQKMITASRMDYPLWKYIEYDKNPNTTILLGDSRMAALIDPVVKKYSGRSVYNFALGGGTMPEILHTFWHVAEKTDLKEVFIGINFELYNGKQKKNHCIAAEEVLNNKWLYFINQSVINSSFLMIKNTLTENKKTVGVPGNRDKFWNRQLKTAANRTYKDYVYPSEFYQKLKEIATYCENKDIELSFVILPTHIDLQNQIIASDRKDELERFIQDMYSLGTVYNFHKKSELTVDKELYSDPFHFKRKVREEVIKYIFEKQAINEEVLTKSR